MIALADLTSPEARLSTAGAMLVVPIGATEQHGPHLPLSTDTDIAVALAGRLASACSAVVSPPIAFGASGEHAGFPGTISIGLEAVELLLLELGRSASETFRRTVFVSAHGGNAAAVERGCARLRAEGRAALAWSPSWTGDAHAGHIETSVMLALHPDRVHLDRAVAGNTTPLAELWPTLRSRGVRACSPNGVLGDPAGATPEEGLRLLARATESLLAAVVDWLARES